MRQLIRSIRFDEEFAYWLKTSRKNADKIAKMIGNITQGGFFNFNKGEKMKYFPNRYSARIDKKNRLIYEKTESCIILLSCKGHYEDK